MAAGDTDAASRLALKAVEAAALQVSAQEPQVPACSSFGP